MRMIQTKIVDSQYNLTESINDTIKELNKDETYDCIKDIKVLNETKVLIVYSSWNEVDLDS